MEPSPELLRLNFHHLRYFWLVAREGHLTRTARRLRVSQSALSHQIGLLEEALGEPLFARDGRSLALTEAGRIVLAYADEVFGAGDRLVSTLRAGRRRGDPLRIGATSTLSRNFFDAFLQPVFPLPEARLRLVSGALPGLLERLAAHELDLVLSNRAAPGDDERAFVSQRLARQPVSLIGPADGPVIRFPEDVQDLPMLLPTTDSAIRAAFDTLCHERGVRPRIVAEVDDMALLRLLARDRKAVALIPAVVVRDELRAGVLREHAAVPGLSEDFYAIRVPRHFEHPLVSLLLSRDLSAELLLEK